MGESGLSWGWEHGTEGYRGCTPSPHGTRLAAALPCLGESPSRLRQCHTSKHGRPQDADGDDGQRLTDITAPLPPAFAPAPAPHVLSIAVSKTAALMKRHQGLILN